jgi:hypothetical protein
MIMRPRVRRLALTAHVSSSVGWLGAVASSLALAVAGVASEDPLTVRGAYLTLELIGWYVLVPLSAASLLTGLISSLGTTWGLFRHYWVLVKLLLTVFATIVLLLQLEPISQLADAATDTTLSADDLGAQRDSLVLHAGGGLLVLLATATLSVYKPRGRTRYGWRKQNETRAIPPAPRR